MSCDFDPGGGGYDWDDFDPGGGGDGPEGHADPTAAPPDRDGPERPADDYPDLYFMLAAPELRCDEGGLREAICARSRAELARMWCERFNWRTSATFSMELYTEEGATILAHEWCKRSSYFMRLWLVAGANDDFVYDQAMVDAYVEGPAFIEFVAGSPPGSRAHRRAGDISALVPTMRD